MSADDSAVTDRRYWGAPSGYEIGLAVSRFVL
jgi:hypothetical protein